MASRLIEALLEPLRRVLTIEIRRDLDHLRKAVGRQESRAARAATYPSLRHAEFKVFSQWGEDGIIQYLLGKVPVQNTTFVEFGVQSYEESNTRFLLENDNWRGLIIDGGTSHQKWIRRTGLDWRHDLTAVSAFVTRENINGLLARAGVTGDIGLLSIDIDGNDYWILEAIEVVTPRILIVEYNSTFGPEHAVSIPYDATFVRANAHPSHLYFGASLAALSHLASRKGYAFVGSNSAGNNAFFVRQDVVSDLPRPTPSEGWVEGRFRESRSPDGRLTLLSRHRDRLKIIADLPLVSVRDGRLLSVRELFGLSGSDST